MTPWKKPAHLVTGPSGLSATCKNCGTTVQYVIGSRMNVGAWAKALAAFNRQHKECKPGKGE